MIVALIAFVVTVVAAVHQFNCDDLRQMLSLHDGKFVVVVGTAVAGANGAPFGEVADVADDAVDGTAIADITAAVVVGSTFLPTESMTRLLSTRLLEVAVAPPDMARAAALELRKSNASALACAMAASFATFSFIMFSYSSRCSSNNA